MLRILSPLATLNVGIFPLDDGTQPVTPGWYVHDVEVVDAKKIRIMEGKVDRVAIDDLAGIRLAKTVEVAS